MLNLILVTINQQEITGWRSRLPFRITKSSCHACPDEKRADGFCWSEQLPVRVKTFNHSVMERFFCILALVIAMHFSSGAQSVVVNPDGSHSTVHQHGNTAIIVNPDGTHSTVHRHGNTGVVVGPDGSHTTVIRHGQTSIVVNPDGTHSTVVHHGNSATVVDPGGPHSSLFHKKAEKDIFHSGTTDSPGMSHEMTQDETDLSKIQNRDSASLDFSREKKSRKEKAKRKRTAPVQEVKSVPEMY